MEAETGRRRSRTTEKEADDQSSISPNLHLPDDVVFDILSRLPVQSLLQYRCVCKSWRTLISSSDSQFIRTHLHRSTTQRLLLTTDPFHKSFDSVDISNQSWKILQSPCNNSISYSTPLCSCDGLILLFVHYRPFTKNTDYSFLLWNPSIRSYKKLRSYRRDSLSHNLLFGLCYDPNIDDYLVVIISQYFVNLCVEIYNTKTNTWDLIQEPCYSILEVENGVLVNGALHWVMRRSNNVGSWVIVYFDLVEGRLKEVPPPSFRDESNGVHLVVLKGCLCVYRCTDQKKVEIWAMNEYGEKESWTNLIVIPNFIEAGIFQCLKPLCFTKKGEVLIEVNKRAIVIYDPKESTFRTLRRNRIVQNLRAVKYVESLVLLNGSA